MKTVKLLAEHFGEISYTKHRPIAVWKGQVDLNETKIALLSHDDWHRVEVPRYKIIEVELPDWLDPEEYIRDQISWEWLWRLGTPKEWPKSWQRGLLKLETSAQKLACIQLLKTKKFRSTFRESLRDQLVAWLEGDSEYPSPFSPRQWEALLNSHIRLEAKRRDAAIYWSF